MPAHLGTDASERANGCTNLQRCWSQELHGSRCACRGGQTFGAEHQFMIAMGTGHRRGSVPKRLSRFEVVDRLERFGDVQATDHARIGKDLVVHGVPDGIRHLPNGVDVTLPGGGQRRTTERRKTNPVGKLALECCGEARRCEVRVTRVEK